MFGIIEEKNTCDFDYWNKKKLSYNCFDSINME